MLHLGPDARFDFLQQVSQGIKGIVFLLQRFALARAHRHMLGDTLFGIGSFLSTLVSRITVDIGL